MKSAGLGFALFSIVLLLVLGSIFSISLSSGAFSPGSVGEVTCTVPVTSGPQSIAVDTANGDVYVGGAGGNLSVISGCAVIGRVDFGSSIYFVGDPAFDSANGDLYVPVCPSSDLYVKCTLDVVSTVSNAIITSIQLSTVSGQAAYDPSNGLIYVTSRGNGGVGAVLSIINSSTNTLVTNLSDAGYNPSSVVYDGFNGNIYFADGAFVRVVSGSSNKVVTSLPGNFGILAYDTLNGNLYVTNNYLNLTVISGSANTVTGSISLCQQPGCSAPFIAFDEANGLLYVPQGPGAQADTVIVVSGASNTVVGSVTVGSGPVSAAYDSFTGYVYVVNTVDGTVSVLAPAIATVTTTVTPTIISRTTTTTQVTTTTTTTSASVPTWVYVAMIVLLIVGIAIGNVLRKPSAKP